MERQPYPPPGSCVAKNSQRPASVETVQGGVPPYGVKETLVVVNGCLDLRNSTIKASLVNCDLLSNQLLSSRPHCDKCSWDGLK